MRETNPDSGLFPFCLGSLECGSFRLPRAKKQATSPQKKTRSGAKCFAKQIALKEIMYNLITTFTSKNKTSLTNEEIETLKRLIYKLINEE